MLINCLYGLVVIPTEKRYCDNNYEEYKAYCTQQIKKLGKIICNDDPDKIFWSLRNALAHKRIFIDSQDGKINKVIFRDKNTFEKGNMHKSYVHTAVEFTVENLKEYALDVAEYYLQLIDSKD